MRVSEMVIFRSLRDAWSAAPLFVNRTAVAVCRPPADFFLLLLACCQRRVFAREECEPVRQLAGSNRQIDEQKLSSGYVIGVPDYITRKG